MIKKFVKVVVSVLLLLYSLMMLVSLICNRTEMVDTGEMSEEIHGTILKTQDTGVDGKHFYLIYTEEHSNPWLLDTFYKEAPQFWEHLKTGDKISFCIKKDDLARINDAMFLDMLTLKKEDTTLYTLDDYNKYLRIQENKMGMIGVVGVCLPFGAALYLILPKKVRR